MQGPLPSSAQTPAFGCGPPEPPYTALPEADLREFRAELSADFERYFSDIPKYIQCLDAERARVMAEGREVAAAYENFLGASTNDENK